MSSLSHTTKVAYVEHNMNFSYELLQAWNSPHAFKRTAARVAIVTLIPFALIAAFEAIVKNLAIVIANTGIFILNQGHRLYIHLVPPKPEPEPIEQPAQAAAPAPLPPPAIVSPPPAPAPAPVAALSPAAAPAPRPGVAPPDIPPPVEPAEEAEGFDALDDLDSPGGADRLDTIREYLGKPLSRSFNFLGSLGDRVWQALPSLPPLLKETNGS